MKYENLSECLDSRLRGNDVGSGNLTAHLFALHVVRSAAYDPLHG